MCSPSPISATRRVKPSVWVCPGNRTPWRFARRSDRRWHGDTHSHRVTSQPSTSVLLSAHEDIPMPARSTAHSHLVKVHIALVRSRDRRDLAALAPIRDNVWKLYDDQGQR